MKRQTSFKFLLTLFFLSVPDPIVHQDESKLKEYEQVDVDLITWRTIIMTSLNRMYGMIGESSPFDIPVKPSLKSIVLKIQTEDEEKFNNSFLSYTFNLNKYTDMDVNAYIKILKKGHHVGLVVGT